MTKYIIETFLTSGHFLTKLIQTVINHPRQLCLLRLANLLKVRSLLLHTLTTASPKRVIILTFISGVIVLSGITLPVGTVFILGILII